MKERDNATTPDWLMPMFAAFHDPCPLFATEIVEPPPGAPIYINPPYSEQPKWVELAIKWHQENHYVVMLIPMESSTLKAKRLLQYGIKRLYFEKRPYEKVRGVELLVLTG